MIDRRPGFGGGFGGGSRWGSGRKRPRETPRVGGLILGTSLSLAAALVACDQRGSEGVSVAPSAHGTDSQLEPEGEFEGESIDELAIRLHRLVDAQDSLVAAGTKDASKCEELCQLSRAICEVKTKMCEIADERVADDEYQDLCRQAKQRCQDSFESCSHCVQRHERASEY